MKKILFLILSMIIISCGTSNQITSFGTSMKTIFEQNYTQELFDSICKADLITNNLNKWKKSSFKDFETGEGFDLYLFIKKTNTYEAIYRLLQNGDSLWISKRVTK